MNQSTAHNLNRSTIDLSRAPIWDFFVELRGMRIPMTSPLEAMDMGTSPIPSQAQIDAQRGRWPGVFVWGWRMIFGSPQLRADMLPDDGGAAHTRATCVVILGEPHRELIDSMSTGECAQLVAAYMGAQEQWMDATRRYVAQIASERYEPTNTASTRVGNGMGNGSGAGSNGMTKLIPGQPLPATLQPYLNPLVRDDRGDSK